MMTAPGAHAGVPETMEGGVKWIELSPGVWENGENGSQVILNRKGEIIAQFKKSEVNGWRRAEEAAGSNASTGPSKVVNSVEKTVPEVTKAEAQDSGTVLTKLWKREGVSETAQKWFTRLASDEGGMLTAAQLRSALGLAVGGFTLGPLAFKLGVDIGNELDEFLGIPTWEEYEHEHEKVTSGGPKLNWEGVGTTMTGCGGHCKFTVPVAGYYQWCQSEAQATEEIEKNGETGKVIRITKLGCAQEGTKVTGTPYTIELGAKIIEPFAWFYMLCKAAKSGEGCNTTELPGVGEAEFPQTGPLTADQEKVNEEHGAHPHPTATAPAVAREPHLTKKQAAEKFWEEEKPFGHMTPEEFNKWLKEHENGKETQKPTELEPGPSFIEKNSPSIQENPENEPAVEPTAPETSGPTVPKIEWPKVASPCSKFPFGVPCWLVERLGEFATNVKAPEWTMNIDGAALHVKLSVAEKLMEIVRGVEAALGCIAVVLLFGRFASSSSGSSGGGGDGDD